MPRAGFASLIGRPNAGKSTLLNRMIGTKVAIVSDKPQTTRNRIVAVKNLADGQIVFVDTPGIHRPLHRLNVRIAARYVEAGADKAATGSYTLTYRWEGGGLFGGKSLRLVGLSR